MAGILSYNQYPIYNTLGYSLSAIPSTGEDPLGTYFYVSGDWRLADGSSAITDDMTRTISANFYPFVTYSSTNLPDDFMTPNGIFTPHNTHADHKIEKYNLNAYVYYDESPGVATVPGDSASRTYTGCLVYNALDDKRTPTLHDDPTTGKFSNAWIHRKITWLFQSTACEGWSWSPSSTTFPWESITDEDCVGPFYFYHRTYIRTSPWTGDVGIHIYDTGHWSVSGYIK